MPIAVSEPIVLDRTIYVGTDHLWALRRLSDGVPIIPSSAKAQIRSSTNDALWVECGIAIDFVNGWITIIIPVAATNDPAWKSRIEGLWDLEVIVETYKYRWAQGKVTISDEVTLS